MKSLYNQILEEREQIIETKSDMLCEAIKNDTVDEGLFGAIVGGLTGLVAGSTIMKSVCKALGIEKGVLYDLLTSKIVCMAAGSAIGGKL